MEDVWCVKLALPGGRVCRLARILSPDEQLRAILASYLNMQPARLQFSVKRRGKPALADRVTAATLP